MTIPRLSRLAAALIAILAVQHSAAAVITVFGPTHYQRATGAPVTERSTFTVGAPGSYTLRLDNGGDAGQFTPATSAVIALNGTVVVTPGELSPEVAAIEKTVTLLAENVLDVQLRGAPGSGLTLTILGEGGGENRAPVADAGPDQSVPVGALVTLDGSASSDLEGDALTYAWTLAPPAGSGATLSDPNAIKPTFTVDVPGTYTATLIVNDGALNSAPDSVGITTANAAPVAEAGPAQSARVGDRVTLDGSGSHDADGDALTYHWTLIMRPAGSQAALSDSAAVRPTFDVDAPGTYVAQLIVNDGALDSAPDTVTITTENSAPVANAGPDQTAFVGAAVTLDGSASHDADGDALSFHWSLTSRPAGSLAELSDASAATPTFAVDRPGTYVAQLIVNDGTVDSAPDSVVIDTQNSPPVANAGPDQSAHVGDIVFLDGGGSTDVDGDLLAFHWTFVSRPAGSAAALSDATAVSPTFEVDVAGTYVAQLIVNDGTVDSAPDSVSITTANSAPVANAGADQSAPVGATITLDGTGSHDVDGDTLSYSWSLTVRPAGSNAVLSDATSAVTTFVIDVAGTYVAQLRVNDGTVDSAPDPVTISTINSKPIANAGPDQTVLRGAVVTLDAGASSDADGDPLSIAWSITARPAGSSAALSDPTAVQPTITPDVAGTYVFQLIVSDTQPLASDPDTVTVIVRVQVPNVVGLQQAAAAAAIAASDLVVGTVTEVYSNSVPAGEVISQSPAAGAVVAAGTAVDLEVSLGPQPVAVPQVVGLLQAEAEAAIVAAQLVVGNVTFEESATVPAGRVISQSPPADTEVAPGSAVDIVVSLGAGAPKLQAIAVTAAASSLARGQSQPYSAIGTWTDGHTEDITATAAWSSTNQPVAIVTAGGVAQALEAGETIVQATRDGITGGAALTVVDAALASIVVTPDNAVLLVGQALTFSANGVLTDGTGQGLAGVVWTSSDPATLQINGATGAATALASGLVTVSATVGTIAGTAGVTIQATVADVTAPSANITTPADNAVVTQIVDVVGTATDANFSRYVLDYAVAGSATFTEILTGTAAVSGAVLGRFDPSVLLNDIYTVRLRVFDRGGNVIETRRTYQVTRDLKVGNFTETFQDLVVPIGTLPIVINRVYDSRDKSVGDFGFGWRLDIQTMRLRANRSPLGQGWQQTKTGGFLPTYCITHGAGQQHKVSVTLPDGKVEEFDMESSPQCQQVQPIQFGTINFVPRAGARGTLAALDGVSFFWSGGVPGAGELLDDSTFEVLNPQRFQYTTPDKYVYVISRTAGVERITDPNGNLVTIGPNGITHSSGPSVTFTRDGSGRITQISAPGPVVHTYAYSASGDLSQHSDAAASLTRYFYNLSHGLIEIRDPRGMRPVRNEYDDSGRLAASIDALGNRIEYAHDLSANRETVTDRLGRVKLLEYDATGNITRETHADGTTTQRTFDARGNALTETNALGGVATHTYNTLDLPLTRRDELGNLVETYTYDATGNVLTFTDGRGNVTTHVYDARGNRIRTTDGEGFQTQWTYDARGNVLTVTDPRGGVTTNVYDANSNLIRVTDPVGKVTNYTYDAAGRRLTESFNRTTPSGVETVETRFVYDAAGRLTQTTHPDGGISRNEYDASGNLTAEIDQLGRRTTHAYDAANRRVKTTFPDTTTEVSTYDAEGQLVARTDRGGRTTTYTFDVRGRVKRTIAPDGTFTERQYDDAGRLIGILDENGHGTTQTLDAAGRVLTEVDATGRTTTYTYDTVGNRTSSTDSGGQTTTYEFDRRNLMTRAVFPGGTSERYVYNQAAQLTSTFDAENAETRLAYDLGGRVTQVTNPLNHSWTFTYDEAGNRISQTDPLGRLSQFQYDPLRRETRRTLPGGLSQQKSYDAAGNLTQRIDYGGAATTYTYDSSNRLVRRTHPDASQVNFSYTPTGQRATAVDARGVTTYSYDSRDRLVAVTQPDGTELRYAYDAAENVTSRTADLGATELTQSFTYDDANRLLTVTDSQARAYSYAYTPAGKVSSLVQPNGVTTSYTYGNVQRLTSLAAVNAGGTVHSFAYTLSPSGRRTRIDEATGVARQYTYDAAGRLTSESVNGAAGYVTAFGYDAAGNRTSRDHTPSGGVLQTTLYTYDDRDRLLMDGAVTQTWDANGRLVTRSDGTSHVWDSEGRLLLTATAGSGSVSHDYDADGHRVRTTSTPPMGAPDVANFLVDTRQGLSHVVVEYTAGGAVRAEYVRGGDQLLAVVRPGGSRFYHADGLGSIRALTDESGAVTDTYEYDAFGTLTARTGTDPNPYLFTGEPLSPISGLYHLRARWLDAASGRFLSVDPKDGLVERPNTLHRYIYANGDPVNFVDPTGEFGFSIGGISISISFQGNLRSISVTGGRAALQSVKSQIGRLGVHSVRALKSLRTAGQQTHHLIEQRLYNANPALRQIWKHVDDMPGVNLSPTQHQAFTNAWRTAFPYSNQAGHIANPTIQQILAAAEKIYAGHPQLLKQIYLALL